MKITDISIDRSHDLAYLRISEEKVVITKNITSDINVDLDRDGNLVGIEYLSLSARFPSSKVFIDSLHLGNLDTKAIAAAENVLN